MKERARCVKKYYSIGTNDKSRKEMRCAGWQTRETAG